MRAARNVRSASLPTAGGVGALDVVENVRLGRFAGMELLGCYIFILIALYLAIKIAIQAIFRSPALLVKPSRSQTHSISARVSAAALPSGSESSAVFPCCQCE